MSRIQTEDAYVISAVVTGIINLILFVSEMLEWNSYGLAFPLFLIEFCLGLFFFLPKRTREIARGIIVASSTSMLAGLAINYYLALVQ